MENYSQLKKEQEWASAGVVVFQFLWPRKTFEAVVLDRNIITCEHDSCKYPEREFR
jgi:hypothetical protein